MESVVVTSPTIQSTFESQWKQYHFFLPSPIPRLTMGSRTTCAPSENVSPKGTEFWSLSRTERGGVCREVPSQPLIPRSARLLHAHNIVAMPSTLYCYFQLFRLKIKRRYSRAVAMNKPWLSPARLSTLDWSNKRWRTQHLSLRAVCTCKLIPTWKTLD